MNNNPVFIIASTKNKEDLGNLLQKEKDKYMNKLVLSFSYPPFSTENMLCNLFDYIVRSNRNLPFKGLIIVDLSNYSSIPASQTKGIENKWRFDLSLLAKFLENNKNAKIIMYSFVRNWNEVKKLRKEILELTNSEEQLIGIENPEILTKRVLEKIKTQKLKDDLKPTLVKYFSMHSQKEYLDNLLKAFKTKGFPTSQKDLHLFISSIKDFATPKQIENK